MYAPVRVPEPMAPDIWVWLLVGSMILVCYVLYKMA